MALNFSGGWMICYGPIWCVVGFSSTLLAIPPLYIGGSNVFPFQLITIKNVCRHGWMSWLRIMFTLLTEWKNVVLKDYILYDSIYITFWKSEKYKNRDLISGCQGLKVGRVWTQRGRTGVFFGVLELSCIHWEMLICASIDNKYITISISLLNIVEYIILKIEEVKSNKTKASMV